jgi:hypothetical protein
MVFVEKAAEVSGLINQRDLRVVEIPDLYGQFAAV